MLKHRLNTLMHILSWTFECLLLLAWKACDCNWVTNAVSRGTFVSSTTGQCFCLVEQESIDGLAMLPDQILTAFGGDMAGLDTVFCAQVNPARLATKATSATACHQPKHQCRILQPHVLVRLALAIMQAGKWMHAKPLQHAIPHLMHSLT